MGHVKYPKSWAWDLRGPTLANLPSDRSNWLSGPQAPSYNLTHIFNRSQKHKDQTVQNIRVITNLVVLSEWLMSETWNFMLKTSHAFGRVGSNPAHDEQYFFLFSFAVFKCWMALLGCAVAKLLIFIFCDILRHGERAPLFWPTYFAYYDQLTQPDLLSYYSTNVVVRKVSK